MLYTIVNRTWKLTSHSYEVQVSSFSSTYDIVDNCSLVCHVWKWKRQTCNCAAFLIALRSSKARCLTANSRWCTNFGYFGASSIKFRPLQRRTMSAHWQSAVRCISLSVSTPQFRFAMHDAGATRGGTRPEWE